MEADPILLQFSPSVVSRAHDAGIRENLQLCRRGSGIPGAWSSCPGTVRTSRVCKWQGGLEPGLPPSDFRWSWWDTATSHLSPSACPPVLQSPQSLQEGPKQKILYSFVQLNIIFIQHIWAPPGKTFPFHTVKAHSKGISDNRGLQSLPPWQGAPGVLTLTVTPPSWLLSCNLREWKDHREQTTPLGIASPQSNSLKKRHLKIGCHSKKLSKELPHDPTILLLGVRPRELKPGCKLILAHQCS